MIDSRMRRAALLVANFGAAMGGSALFWLVVGAIPFLLPLLFQTVTVAFVLLALVAVASTLDALRLEPSAGHTLVRA